MKKAVDKNWYSILVNDLKALAWTGLVELKHAIGKRILADEEKFGKPGYGEYRISGIAKEIGVNRSELIRCVQFARKYPDLELMPGGHQCSWRHIKNKLLPEPKEEGKATEEIVLPEGKFSVIVCDPPWKYFNRSEDETHRGRCKYPTMTVEEIEALDVPALAADDCILWLWTTNAFMHEAHEIVALWGFEVKTILTWAKHKMGVGHWLRGKTEHALLCVSGSPKVNLTNQTTLLEGRAREHSRKPEEFYEMVESLCIGKKIELFARTERDGWTAYGNETTKFNRF